MKNKPQAKKKEPIDILRNKIVSDANVVRLFGGDERINSNLFSVYQVFITFVRKTEMPDHLILDSNHMIGVHTDDIKFIEPDDYKKYFWIIRSNIEEYQEFCLDNKLDIIWSNFQRLKECKEDNAIYE